MKRILFTCSAIFMVALFSSCGSNAGSGEAARELLQRCIVKATRNKKAIGVDDITESVVSALTARMAELDPLAEIRIALNCSECDHRWEVLLDIQTFFWEELGWQVKQSLNQIHILSINRVDREKYIPLSLFYLFAEHFPYILFYSNK